jgi:hypothetical protein
MMQEENLKEIVQRIVQQSFPDMKRVIYGGVVKDIEDPLNIGRIRLIPDAPENVTQILSSYEGKTDLQGRSVLDESGQDIAQFAKFTDNDPFVYIPLLPFNLNIVPSKGEYVHIFYMDKSNNGNRRNQFYLPGPKSVPMNITREVDVITRSLFSEGMNIAKGLQIKDNDGQFRQSLSKGVFAELSDVGIYAKGRSDIILKDNEVLIRSSKTKTLLQDKFPEVNEKRSFLQLSNFDSATSSEPPYIKKVKVPIKTFVSKLIEYDIENIDNPFDAFTGSIKIYGLPNIPLTQVDKFNENTVIPTSFETPIFYYQFIGLPLSSVTTLINSVITGLNDGNVDISGTSYNQPSDSSQFPFYFRPTKLMTNPSFALDGQSKLNLVNLRSGVQFLGSVGGNGVGLVSDKNKMGLPFRDETQSITYKTTTPGNISYGVVGSDNLYLLSYNSVIPGKTKIDLGKTTVYGITEKSLSTDFKDNTEGLVRGDSLKELLNAMINFLISHGHPFHGMPPIPTGSDEILKQIAQFDTKIINQNIRIN